MHARKAFELALLLAIVWQAFSLPMNQQPGKAAPLASGAEKDMAAPVEVGKNGRLTYNSDENGNRIIDFSACGYRGGGVTIPNVPAKLVVGPIHGDATAMIQKAIDKVSAMKPDANGWRGAVLLLRGAYRISGQLRIHTGGVVLRGCGSGKDGTVLIATGWLRRPLILAGGTDDRELTGNAVAIKDKSVPVGAVSFRIEKAAKLKPGMDILIERPSSSKWIHAIGMDRIPSGSGRYKFYCWGKSDSKWPTVAGSLWWDRKVTRIEDDRVTIDAPITTAIDAEAGGTLHPYVFPGRVAQVGIENLRCHSEYDVKNPKDENHSWDAVRLQNVMDAWVCNVTAEHFAASAVSVHYGTRRVTVVDCESRDSVCEDGTGRGRAFYTLGQQVLFLRCKASGARRAFATGRGLWETVGSPKAIESGSVEMPVLPAANGPIAFVDCVAQKSSSPVGPIAYWASGVLYDNVTVDGTLELTNRGATGYGFGWNAANSVLWNCRAKSIRCDSPPTARNWQIGGGDQPAAPKSLYTAQLRDRFGADALAALAPGKPPTASRGVEMLDPGSVRAAPKPAPKGERLAIRNGWFLHNNSAVWGYAKFSGYWRTSIERSSLTRNGLDDVCQGRTEDIDKLTTNMARYAYPAWYHSYGLWYDRRRDQHITHSTPSGDVASPFFELPWERSGKGVAANGLSKYDLTKFNSFYFEQLRKFAEAADRKGLILLHNFHLQHCITGGSRSHYAEFPWRPVNCIQKVAMPDGLPAANAFYDISNPLHADLHRRYIRKCLDILGDYKNVVHLTSAEYSGPASFTKFWIDTITDWEKETGKDVKIGLGATKDVMDEILADRKRAANIDVLELTYWCYLPDGKVFSKPGGKQVHVGWAPGTSPEMIYRQVSETRRKYPDKGVIKLVIPDKESGGWGGSPEVWADCALACFMGGGALPVFHNHLVVNSGRKYKPPRNTPAIQPFYDFINKHLADRLGKTAPVDVIKNHPERNWCLAEPGKLYLAYASRGGQLTVDLSGTKGKFIARRLDVRTGKLEKIGDGTIEAGKVLDFAGQPDNNPWLLWLDRRK